jgi:hypothetical protein
MALQLKAGIRRELRAVRWIALVGLVPTIRLEAASADRAQLADGVFQGSELGMQDAAVHHQTVESQ